MKRAIRAILLAGVILTFPTYSMAWGVLGHRIVGQIASSYLKTKTRLEIQKILGIESLAMASNWMDFIRSDPSFKYMNNWHYVDLEPGLTYAQVSQYLRRDTSTNIYTKLNFVITELKKKDKPMKMKQMYLRILIHLAGDIHQPLHSREEDSGGSNFKVTWFSNPSNLHTVWDSELINFQQLSYTEYASSINHPGNAELKIWQNDITSKWVYESYKLGGDILKAAQSNTKFSYRYNFDHITEINQQLLKGGVRLAGILNQIYGS